MCCSFISEPGLFPVCVECNVISFLHAMMYCVFSAEISLLHSPLVPPALPQALFCHCLCTNWAEGCPSHSSSAREQASNSTLPCSPAEHVMK